MAVVSQILASSACERVIQQIQGTDIADRLMRKYWSPLRAISGLHCADQWLWCALIADKALPPTVESDVRELRKWWGRAVIAMALACTALAAVVVNGFFR
jgi:hypothetical protein